MRDYVRDPIVASTSVHAPIERCWALSTRVELVQKTLGMRLAGGVTTGHIQADSRVLWRGWKFGLPTNHHTVITAYEAPHDVFLDSQEGAHQRTAKEACFQDSQEKGRFALFQHEHMLRERQDRGPITELHDEIRFALPFGIFGKVAAELLLAPHIRRLAQQRFALIKQLAEGEGWREWMETSSPKAARLHLNTRGA